jgi:hypothetical protein
MAMAALAWSCKSIWPSGLRRRVKAAVFWAGVRIPLWTLIFWFFGSRAVVIICSEECPSLSNWVHITLTAPLPVRSEKLSNVEPG